MDWNYIFGCTDCEFRQSFRTQGERDAAARSHVQVRPRQKDDPSKHRIFKKREAR